MKFISSLLIATTVVTFGQSFPLEPLLVEADHLRTSATHATWEEDQAELASIPGGTESVDAERFLTGRSSTLADVFFLSPGIVAQPRFGSDEARISIRGSGLQRTFHGRGIRLMQDGIPLNLADGGFDMQSIDPLATSHVNVWRGGNALSNGSSTLGGAIDFRSSTGWTAPGTAARIEGGSYDSLRARLATGVSEGSQDLYLSMSHASQDGFREHAEQSAQRFFGNFGRVWRDGLESRLFLTAIHTDSQLPGLLTRAEMEADPRQADRSPFGSLRYDNRRDFELYRIAHKATLQDGDDLWNFTAGWTYKDLDHPITPFVGVLDQLSNDLVAAIGHTSHRDWLGRSNRLRSGITITRGETNASAFENILGSRGDLRARDQQSAANLEAFVENRHSLTRELSLTTALSGGVSTRQNKRAYTQPSANPPFFFPPPADALLSYDETYSNIAPHIGLLHESGEIQVFAGFSGSYEPPSFAETVTANTAREAQTAHTAEIGSRGSHSFARWDATLYLSRVHRELLTLTDPATLVSTTANADRTIHHGIELGTEIDLLGQHWAAEAVRDRWVLRGTYTWGEFRFDDDPVYQDNRIAGIPPHLLRGEVLWENARGYYFGPTWEWVPVKSYIDHRNTFAADPYALIGLKFGCRVAAGVSWFVEARNLTGETYAATHGVIENAGGVDQRQFLPGDGRSIFAGIEWKF